MAKNNLPKLKQIQGGLQLRQDVNVLQDLFANLNASQIATTIEIPENSGKYYNVAEILTLLNDKASTSGSDIETLKTDVENLENVQIADYVRIRGTITTASDTVDEVTTYTYDATFDDSEKVAELRAQALSQNTACILYTEDNTVLTDEHGVPVTINLQNGILSSKLFIADIENVSESEEMVYVPVTEDITFKIFPVGNYTLSTIDKDFLLDNEEMKAVYYQSAIDDLAFKLANNKKVLETVQELIGTKSVAQAIADATASITSNFQAADTELNNKIDALSKTVSDNETDIEGKVSALDTRVTTAEGSITTLNGDKETAGSVLNTVHSVTDPIANRVTVTENNITTLNSDANTPGSVAHTVKSVVDPVKTDLTNLTTRVTNAETSITTLNGDKDTAGSVLNTVHGIVDPVSTDLATTKEKVDKNTTDISTNTQNISKNATDIATNSADIKTIKESLEGSQGDITTLTETVNRLDEKEETWDAQSSYTNATPIVQAHGDIKEGDTFENVPITEMLTKLLYPYVAQTVNKFNVNTEGSYEIGEVVAPTECVINYTKKSNELTACSIKVDTTKVESEATVPDVTTIDVDVTSLVSNTDYTEVIEKEITRDATFTLTLNDGKTAVTKSASVKFYRPAYFGFVDTDADLTNGNALKEVLTKYVQAPATVKFNYPVLTDKRLVALVPSTWAISSIVDNNSFDVTKAFTKSTVTVTCLDGSDLTYNLYYTDKCSLTNKSTYTFNK